ncbi:MAG: hypothetical protein KGS61_13775, partial [Verrucomicrobia bacterium]|nr:hypothetical protein [Verrucomicrobiota bacterium]
MSRLVGIDRLLGALCLLLLAGTAPAEVPHHKPDGSCIKDWLLVGPFFPDALDRDFLAAVGGESKVSPREGDAVVAAGEQLAWKLCHSRSDVIDLNAWLGPRERATAYAFCLIESDHPTVGTLKLGSDDGASVFLNGQRILHQP